MSTESQWQVRKDGRAYAGGPASTLPPISQRRSMRACGYAVYLDGKRMSDLHSPGGDQYAKR